MDNSSSCLSGPWSAVFELDMGRKYSVLQLLLSALYGLLSLSIVCHIAVAAMLIKIISRSSCKDVIQNCIYVLALTIVDAMVVIHLPLLAVEVVEQEWTFGPVLCQFFWVAESVNKILSTFLLTSLCFDRYLAVCFPLQSFNGLRNSRNALATIILCIISAFALLSPMYANASLEALVADENFTTVKCIVNWSLEVERYFTATLFIVGYCIPILLMAYFYWKIIRRFRRRIDMFRISNPSIAASYRNQLRTITRRSFSHVIFYFICWTPFWLISFLHINADSDTSDFVVVILYIMHALVYLNSAMNPIFYALFNKELRHYASRRTSRMWCNNNNSGANIRNYGTNNPTFNNTTL